MFAQEQSDLGLHCLYGRLVNVIMPSTLHTLLT